MHLVRMTFHEISLESYDYASHWFLVSICALFVWIFYLYIILASVNLVWGLVFLYHLTGLKYILDIAPLVKICWYRKNLNFSCKYSCQSKEISKNWVPQPICGAMQRARAQWWPVHECNVSLILNNKYRIELG